MDDPTRVKRSLTGKPDKGDIYHSMDSNNSFFKNTTSEINKSPAATKKTFTDPIKTTDSKLIDKGKINLIPSKHTEESV